MLAPSRKGIAYPQDAVCNAPHCTKKPDRRGLCENHYRRWRRGSGISYESQPIPGLRKVRQELGLTQRELAEEVGVHRVRIWHIERGGVAFHDTVRKVHITIRRLARERKERMVGRKVRV